MKRSEMIKHIAAELQVIACIVEGPRSIEMPRAGYFQRRAAGLLYIIEKFGMQPPLYAKSINDDEYFTFVNEWEDEQ
jgi:hypothetical protein